MDRSCGCAGGRGDCRTFRRHGGVGWSLDGTRVAYGRKLEARSGLMVASADGSGKRFLTKLEGTNSRLPSTGKTVDWVLDGRRLKDRSDRFPCVSQEHRRVGLSGHYPPELGKRGRGDPRKWNRERWRNGRFKRFGAPSWPRRLGHDDSRIRVGFVS